MQEVAGKLYVGGSEGADFAEAIEGAAVVRLCDGEQFADVLRERGMFEAELDVIDEPLTLILKLENAVSPGGYSVERFREAVRFISAHHAGDASVVVFGENGRSRAPSIALLYLAAQGDIPASSYAEATGSFKFDRYEDYDPSRGLATFLSEHWTELIG
jgi:hypothetical protein